MKRILPAAGPATTLALAQLTNSIGDGAYYVCSALYTGLGPFVVAACCYATSQCGLALRYDSRAAYLAVFAMDAVSFLAYARLLRRLPAVAAVEETTAGESRLAVLRDRPYALVTLLNTVLLLRMPLLSLAIPLWTVQRTSAPSWTVSALLLLNTVAVMLFQVRAARRVTGLETAARAVRRSGAVLLASCVVFAMSGAGMAGWVAGVVLLAGASLQVVGESSPSTWRPTAGRASTRVSSAPASPSPAPSARCCSPRWLLLGGFFLVAGAVMGPAARWAERSSTPVLVPLAPRTP